MTNKRLRIAFMGTPDFSVPALDKLHKGPHEVVCVYSQPPRPKGRGHKVQLSPVHAYAEENGIPVFHPKSLKSPEEQALFNEHNLDVAVVAAYGLILPKAVLNAPEYGCINIHASLLPRWRGASPIQRAIWQGDDKTGVTLMQMDEGLDTGPEIMKEEVSITSSTTAQSLHDQLSALGGDMIIKAINELATQGALKSTSQDDSRSTYAPLLKKEDGLIDWSKTAQEIDRQIRALNPWPGTYIGDKDNRLKIFEASLSETSIQNQLVGILLNRNGDITCGANTALQLKRVQPAGKKPMDIVSAINGGYLKPGELIA